MVDMVDIPAAIIRESVRRAVEQARDSIDSGEVELDNSCPFLKHIDPEEIKDIAALGIVMTRIIRSVSYN